VLRSKSLDLVLQEIWGHLCCHYAIRSLMSAAADGAGHDPDRVSFVAALRISRATLAHAGAFPPGETHPDEHRWRAFLIRLLARLNPARRRRAAPRVIKRKMPKWQVKRAHHADWPQPLYPPRYTTLTAKGPRRNNVGGVTACRAAVSACSSSRRGSRGG